ncbi:restriction endonuclease subunit S [Niveibacterium microcysteis]|uniref:Restriction endonuclease subunit S n=1 Tax=Niveibacterium microcysteis TaxID=2811415 RepID=A0ABX7MDL0_9RHOO|nr:restriction endonuclease subunit S [Niveibacterium microcysteis]QSI78775.1 restriction endonuclease subunit S [Niveibacterium microcysteis]
MTAKMVSLSSCITPTKGKPPAEMPYFGDGAEPYLSPEYLRRRGNAEPAKPAANAVRVKDGDTVLLWDGSNAGEFFRGRQGLLASTMTHLGHSKEFEPEYFCYATKRWESYLKGQTSGSGIPHVDKEVLGKLEILLLPSDEQSLVANILKTLDQAIEQTEALIAKQQRIKTGLMQDLLTKGIDKHGNIRSEATHAFKDSPLGRIPQEWDVSPADSLCEAVIDCKNRTPPEAAEGHPVIRTPNVRNGEFVWTDLAFTDSASYETWTARGQPRAGDVVITREAPFGEACIIPENLFAPCLGQRMMMYRPSANKVRADYFVYAIQSDRVQKKLLELAGGSTVGHIRVGDIRTLPIPHPIDVKEQESIASVLNGVAIALKDASNSQRKFAYLKAGLMHDMLTGERRVTPLLSQAVQQ